MKRFIKFSAAIICLALIYMLFKLNLLSGNANSLNHFLSTHGNYKEIIFIALSSLRILALIPSAVFMVLGGIMFNPIEGFILTFISIVLSETFIYILSKIFVGSAIQNYLVNKYPKLYNMILKNDTKILAIGISCPITPSDVSCFLASFAGIRYKKYIITVVAANIPMMILYNLLGNSVMSSSTGTVITAAIIALISIVYIYLWKKVQKQQTVHI